MKMIKASEIKRYTYAIRGTTKNRMFFKDTFTINSKGHMSSEICF
jgi:hypothetical protein